MQAYWKTVETAEELAAARQLRSHVLKQELGVSEGRLSDERARGACWEDLSRSSHIVVYMGGRLVATGSLMWPSLLPNGERHRFDIERSFDIDSLPEALLESTAELARLCVAKPWRGTEVTGLLYAGLVSLSRERDVRYWIGGVDCRSSDLRQARRVVSELRRIGAVSETHLVNVRHGRRASGQLLEHRSAAGVQRPDRRRDSAPCEELPRSLEAITHALGATCIGPPALHPTLPRLVLPMLVELVALPARTLGCLHAHRSSYSPAPAVVHASAIVGPTQEFPMGTLNLHSQLMELGRDAVRRLDEHPLGGRLVRGTLTRREYVNYLAHVVDQVRDSGPLLQRASERLRSEHMHPRVAELFREKALEEDGHDAWALHDLAALGVSPEQVRNLPVSSAVHAYRAWLRYVSERSPIGVLGLAFVLEWLAHSRASRAAENLVQVGSIPNVQCAVRFLARHGEADAQHIRTLTEVLRDVHGREDVDSVLLSARVTTQLYLGFFDSDAGNLRQSAQLTA